MKALKFLLISLIALPAFVNGQIGADTQDTTTLPISKQLRKARKTIYGPLSPTDRARFKWYRAAKKYNRINYAIENTQADIARLKQTPGVAEDEVEKLTRRLERLQNKLSEADQAVRAAQNAIPQAQAAESKPATSQFIY